MQSCSCALSTYTRSGSRLGHSTSDLSTTQEAPRATFVRLLGVRPSHGSVQCSSRVNCSLFITEVLELREFDQHPRGTIELNVYRALLSCDFDQPDDDLVRPDLTHRLRIDLHPFCRRYPVRVRYRSRGPADTGRYPMIKPAAPIHVSNRRRDRRHSDGYRIGRDHTKAHGHRIEMILSCRRTGHGPSIQSMNPHDRQPRNQELLTGTEDRRPGRRETKCSREGSFGPFGLPPILAACPQVSRPASCWQFDYPPLED